MAITYAQVVVSVAVAAAYAAGLIFTAGFLVLFAGTLDILDGKVARRSNGASPRGAFLDSVMDRYAEFLGYAGLMVFFGSGWLVWAVLLAILGGMMVSYTRARAEGLGVRCEIGMLQRPERFVLLGFGSIFSSLAAHLVRRPAGAPDRDGGGAGRARERHGSAAHRVRQPPAGSGRWLSCTARGGGCSAISSGCSAPAWCSTARRRDAGGAMLALGAALFLVGAAQSLRRGSAL